MKKYNFTATSISEYIADLRLYIATKTNFITADRMIVPLVYYINTGRACTDFLKKLASTNFYSIYTILRKEKSIDETIKLLKKKLKIDDLI